MFTRLPEASTTKNRRFVRWVEKVGLAVNEELTRKLERLRGSALALARERVRLQMASYQAGRVDLGAVLTARRDLVETELKAIDTEAALYALRARLAYLIAEHRP